MSVEFRFMAIQKGLARSSPLSRLWPDSTWPISVRVGVRADPDPAQARPFDSAIYNNYLDLCRSSSQKDKIRQFLYC